MSSSPDSGLSLEEQLEQKWSLESLECMDVQALISMWWVNSTNHFVLTRRTEWMNSLLYIHIVGFEVLTAVVMKSSVFSDITLCGPLKVNRHFGGTCCFPLQGRRIPQARNQHEAVSKHSQSTSKVYSCYALCFWISRNQHTVTTSAILYSLISAIKHKRNGIMLANCFVLVSCLPYSLTLKMEATCSSETSVDFQRTTRRHIQEARTLLYMLFGRLVPSLILVMQNSSLQIQLLLAHVLTWLFYSIKINVIIIHTEHSQLKIMCHGI
jgi:hypothetical protein